MKNYTTSQTIMLVVVFAAITLFALLLLKMASVLYAWNQIAGIAAYTVVILPVFGYILPFLFSKAISDGIYMARFEQARRMTKLVQEK